MKTKHEDTTVSLTGQVTKVQNENLQLHREIEMLKTSENPKLVTREDLVALRNAVTARIDKCCADTDRVVQDNENMVQVFQNVLKSPVKSQISKINAPVFKNLENERPIKFFNQFERYLDYIKPQKSEFAYIIEQNLGDSVKEWWYLQNNITDFANFSLKF